jgi:hypothetical protein
MSVDITLEQFIERFNQESDWNGEILDSKFFENRPFVRDNFIGYLGTSKITPELYDYDSAQLYEDDEGEPTHYFECQMYCNETYGTRYLWIHPDFDKKAYKEDRIRIIKRGIAELDDEVTSKINELAKQKSELDDLLKAITKQD